MTNQYSTEALRSLLDILGGQSEYRGVVLDFLDYVDLRVPPVELPSRHPDAERLDYLDSRLQLGHRFTMGSYPQPDIEAKTIRELIDKMRGGADEPAGGCIHCGGEHE